jgi:hypothetical protein
MSTAKLVAAIDHGTTGTRFAGAAAAVEGGIDRFRELTGLPVWPWRRGVDRTLAPAAPEPAGAGAA